MVEEPEHIAHLSALITEHPQIIARYLLTAGRLSILLLDRRGTILDCNFFFLENIGLGEKPVGQSIETFLAEAPPAEKIDEAQLFRNVRLSFKLEGSSERRLSGQMIDLGRLRIVFAHEIRLTDHEMLDKMSRLTDELTDLTRELNKKNRELAEANVKITQLMNTDPLTGLVNRRRLMERLDEEMSKARRHGDPLSAVMIDIDFFKSINDTFGHDAGDKVLIGLAQTIRSICRKEDIAARLGGEEFLLLLPGSPTASARDCAERIRKAVEATVFEGIDRPVTASFGISLFSKNDTQESFLKRADEALYSAKKSGRNRIVFG
jgi:diguanylate cyclase (GGDEF)-like protein